MSENKTCVMSNCRRPVESPPRLHAANGNAYHLCDDCNFVVHAMLMPTDDFVRPAITKFARFMEQQLDGNSDHAPASPSRWQETDLVTLVQTLKMAVLALENGIEDQTPGTVYRAAEVANFAMVIATKAQSVP